MKVATFNLNGVNGRLDLLLKWLAAAQPRRRLPAGVEGRSEVDRKTRRTAFALTSVRGHLIALVSGLAALLFAATCFIVVYTFEQNREDFQDRLLAASKAVSAATDRQLVQAAATAVTLSRDPDLQNARWARFHHRARDLDLALPGWLMVEDDAGGVVLDSQLPLGTASAPRAPPEGRVTQIGRLPVTVTGVRFAAQGPVVEVHAPFVARGRRYDLIYVLPVSAIDTVVREQRLPKEATASVFDDRVRLVARSTNTARFAGITAPADLRTRLAVQTQGFTKGLSLDGVPATGAFYRSPETGWTSLVVVAETASTGRMIRAVAVTTAMYMVLFGAGLALCLVLSRKIDKQMTDLVEHAAALNGPGEITAPQRELQEVRKVREAITRAKLELAAREKRQQLLINELNHRVKNSLATVQSLARQCFRREAPAAYQAFDERLIALSKAHDLIAGADWTTAPIRKLATEALAPQLDRIELAGPELEVNGEAAVSLAMVLHELMTNSAKYGSLSAFGLVRLNWETRDGEIRLEWRETGGPPVEAPVRTGFGTRLMKSLTSGELRGEIKLEYLPQGLRATMTMPLATDRRWSTV